MLFSLTSAMATAVTLISPGSSQRLSCHYPVNSSPLPTPFMRRNGQIGTFPIYRGTNWVSPMLLSALPSRCSQKGFLYTVRSLSLPPSLSLALFASRSALFPIAGPSHRISVGHPPPSSSKNTCFPLSLLLCVWKVSFYQTAVNKESLRITKEYLH